MQLSHFILYSGMQKEIAISKISATKEGITFRGINKR